MSPVFTTPKRHAPPPEQLQNVTDFNYTPSHQKPFLQPQAGTTVTTHQDIKEIVEMTLGSEGVLNQAVKLPRGEDENEWLAVHCVDFTIRLICYTGPSRNSVHRKHVPG
ncbi:Mob1p [Saccharomyces cerevisiae x Saccharomyces kudriavzevii VIN7]|uniref:Mob1p n=1 Tax=Saccharomyces cerevisiae x Saccharomyces kudriavzevii (strain VIN7) TaxID=1095631 RepID=H0GW78_SACCK|nr:Mob1p [Saccharomyces cerevisiae x Saccharomyces kudriavzevii VIN7]